MHVTRIINGASYHYMYSLHCYPTIVSFIAVNLFYVNPACHGCNTKVIGWDRAFSSSIHFVSRQCSRNYRVDLPFLLVRPEQVNIMSSKRCVVDG